MHYPTPRQVCLAVRCRQLPSVAFALALPAVVATPVEARTEPSLAVDMSLFGSHNPLLLSGSGNGAVMFEIAASPEVLITSPRGSTIEIGGTIKRRDYSRRYGDFLLGDARIEVRQRNNEYLTIGAMAGYDRSLAIDLLSSSPDVALDPKAIRNSWFAALDADWRPTAFELFRPELRVEHAFYSAGELLRDSRTFVAGLAYSKQTGPRTYVGVRVRDTINGMDGMANINNAAVYATLNRQFGQRGRLVLELGAEKTGRQIETIEGQKVRRPGRTLLAGRVDLCRDAADALRGLNGCLSGSLDSEVSGLGGLRRNATVTGSVRKPIGQSFVLRGSADYRRSTLVGARQTTGPSLDLRRSATDAVRGIVALDWKARRNFTVTGTVEYLRRQLDSGQRIGAGFVGIQLSYRPGPRR